MQRKQKLFERGGLLILCELSLFTSLCKIHLFQEQGIISSHDITNRFSLQTQRSHSEKKMVAQANRTTKDNLYSLIKEKNLSPNHWCHHLGETPGKKTHNHLQNNGQNAV